MKVNIFGLIKELVNSMYFILHVHVCYFEIMIEILTSLSPPQKKKQTKTHALGKYMIILK